MWVNNDIGLDAAFAERHVDCGPFLRADTLLAVTRRKLVSYDGCTRDAESNMDLLEFRVTRVRAYCNNEPYLRKKVHEAYQAVGHARHMQSRLPCT